MLNSYNIYQPQKGEYIFTTDTGIIYSVYILDDQGYFIDYPEFSAEVSTFGFSLVSNPLRKTPFDTRVRDTITGLIINYLCTNPDKILFFVCDSADERQRGRMRIFELWYNQLKVEYIEKYNESVITNDMDIHCSIMLHRDNYMRKHIISSFRDLCYITTEKLKSY